MRLILREVEVRMSARYSILLIVIVVAVLAVDRVTKEWIVQNLALGESRQPIPAIQDFFQITRSANTGAAFGLFSGAGDIFMVIAVVVVLAMFYFYPRLPANATATRIGIGLICGGALGNAIDRFRFDHVVDFIHYQIPGVISNVSNLADHAVVLGVLIVLLDSWRLERQDKESPVKSEQNSETSL
jgi:signal peptidase II